MTNATATTRTGSLVTLRTLSGGSDTRTIMRVVPGGYVLSNGVKINREFVGACYTGRIA